MNDQLPLFNQRTMRPKTKVPISAERIKEVKALLAAGQGDKAAAALREIREKLEDYERRITNS